MKIIYPIITAVLLTTILFLPQQAGAQAPQKMSYQAVIRNSSDALVTNTQVGMQISILQGSADGTPVYIETQSITTNANGLVSIEIGTGTTSDDFSTIDWANSTYFIKTETDPTGGTTYTITGTSQLLSVPYALHAKTAESYTGTITETDPVFTSSQAANITETDISNLSNLYGTNTGNQDISGITTNATAITSIQGEQTTQDAAIALNTEKVGITTAQSDAIITNTGKDTTGIFHANRAALDLVSGTNTGDQDLNGITTNATAITNIQGEQTTQNTAIALNTEKVGITTAQSDAIITNTGKDTTGIYHANRAALDLVSGTNTGDQDINGITTNATAITNIQGEQTTQDAAIALNTAKDTTGIHHANRTVLDLVSGTNTGDQDITAMTHTNRAALDVVSGTNTGDQTLATLLNGNTSAGSNKITELADPIAEQDAATKAYVDALEQQIEAMQNALINVGSIVKDYDGNVYGIVTIGTQKWMTENLKTTHYANGDAIPDGTGAGDISGETEPEYWFAYGDDLNNLSTYGRLYTWYTVTDSRNVCPDGWHVPTDAEWTTMENYLIANGYNYDGTTTGNKIAKSLASKTRWTSSANTGDVGNTDYPTFRNKTGFTALPGGGRNSYPRFLGIGNYSFWWSATEGDELGAWCRSMDCHRSDVDRGITAEESGLSVRCVRD